MPASAASATRDRLWTLLQALSASYFKVDLLARLAAHEESRGEREEAARSVAAAVAAVAARGKGWELLLIRLANELPSAGQPGYEDQLQPLRTAAYTPRPASKLR